jgi:hypothetical protein
MSRCMECGMDIESTGHFCGVYRSPFGIAGGVTTPAPRGWICPNCGAGVSPFATTCTCHHTRTTYGISGSAPTPETPAVGSPPLKGDGK